MDNQFYPTPQALAKKLWAKFKAPIKLVLDPQAGEGHLVTAYMDYFPDASEEEEGVEPLLRRERRRALSRRDSGETYRRRVKWHACEIDPQKHPLLQKLGADVVGHDFLQMQSAAIYSHLVMNPPFRDGARHLAHAWKVLYSGEIGCILNAETLRNPYTKERQFLVALIEKCGSVEFLADQFLGEGVERESPVEVALVYLRKQAEHAVDMEAILEGLTPDDFTPKDNGDTRLMSALALPMNFVDRVVLDYEIAVNAAMRFSEASAVFQAAEQRLGRTFSEMQSKGLAADNRGTPIDFASVVRSGYEEHLVAMRERAWAQVLRSTQLLNKLSSAAQRSVESQFVTISKLEFTKSNIHGFFAGLLESMGEINADMVLSLFDMILQRDSDNCTFYRSWKSNEKHKSLAMRIKRTRFILPLMQHEYTRSRLSIDAGQVLGDIDKVFRLLHGKPAESGNGLRECLTKDINFEEAARGKRIDTEFFSVRYYPGRGTFHFFPKSVDVVERLNRFVGKMRQWLPPDIGHANADFKRQYDEAEKYSGDYLKVYREGCSNASHPVYLLSGRSSEESVARDAERMSQAMEEVQNREGIAPFESIQARPSERLQLVFCE